MSYQLAAELLNFGAFIAFMGVNLSALKHHLPQVRSGGWKNVWLYFVPPALGFLVCFYLWLSLRTPAKLAGVIWLLLGITCVAWRTGFFRRPIPLPEIPK
jgi:hypothetical protein